VERDNAHQDHYRAHETRRYAPEGAYDQCRNGEGCRHFPERELDRIEHLVDQRTAFHHVAHQHKKWNGDEHVVGHRAVGALDHQLEHLVIREDMRRVIEGDKAEEHAEAHQGEGRRESHHDHNHDEAEHQKPECGITHVLRSPPMPRCRAVSSISLARSMAILRDSSSTYSLCASCSSTTSISATSASRLGHSPVLRHITQRTISATPCSITSAPAIGMIVLKW